MQGLKQQLSGTSRERDEPAIPFYMQILIYLNLFIYIYDGFWDVPNRKLLGVGLSILLVLISIWKLRNYINWIDVIIPLLFFGILLYARLVSHSGRTSFLNNLPYALIGFSLGVSLKYMKWPKWSFYSYMIITLLPFLYSFFILKIDMNNFRESLQMNRNSVPILLLLTYSLLIISEAMDNKKCMPLIPLLLIVGCSFYSKSRTGLLVSVVLLLLIGAYNGWFLITKYKHANFDWRVRLTIGLAIVVAGGLLIGSMVYVFTNSRFATEGFDSNARIAILQKFFQEITWKKALTGFIPDLFETHSRIDASFAMAFSYIGVMSIFLGGAVLFACIVLWKHSFLLFCLLGVHTVYGFAEWLSPLELGDTVLIPLLMIAFSLYNPGAWLNKPISMLRKKSI